MSRKYKTKQTVDTHSNDLKFTHDFRILCSQTNNNNIVVAKVTIR